MEGRCLQRPAPKLRLCQRCRLTRCCGLQPDGISLVPASLDLVSIGANHSDTQVFTSALVRIDTEGLIRDLEANPIACKPPHDFGHVNITAPGAVNCANDATFTIVPVIPRLVSPRRTILATTIRRVK